MLKLRVTTHGGEEHIIEVEEYNVEELDSKRNNHDVTSIIIGNCSFSRIDLKNVVPIENEKL